MSTPETRCPQCSALLRSDAAWCTLCHVDLRPAPLPVPELVSVPDQVPLAPVPPVAAPDPLTAPFDQVIAAALADQAADQALEQASLEAAEAAARDAALGGPVADPASRDPLAGIQDTDVMFALLRGESQDPILAKFGGRFDDPTTRIAFIVGGIAVLTLVLIVGFSAVGFLFG